ncbi:hypothetical protein BGW36DRAFT_378640 [Talaromyces proteolyticus]|uniref:Uncharacterized protein n=1 Tax=Talaromyces proteolyticus TaxID=1131652 RepID=A0AAD4KSJ5_9EURO|nr:uncharacterized protein BGW36DRAFT_378640 [Talaromyces proteolyticus]KAH8697407.1 hypothetical protein BGW36DRAFT_378640 [Talaromyces proteolyticus]
MPKTRYRDTTPWSQKRDRLDPEKAASPYDSSISDDEPVYSDTSRVTSGSLSSHIPMLASPSRRRRPRANGFMPHRLMRCLCLALFVALLLFVLNLFRFTLFGRAEQVPIDVPKPPPKPHVWESFPFLKRYHGGIRSLVARKDNVPEYPGDGAPEDLVFPTAEEQEQAEANKPQEPGKKTAQRRSAELPFKSLPYNPYPNYKTEEYARQYGEKVDCFLDEDNKIHVPRLQYYPGIPDGFPDPIMGSNAMLGIQDDICFDRFGRLGPYGLGYGVKKGGSGAGMEGDRDGADRVWEDVPPVDFREISWATAQNRCIIANRHRFAELPEPRVDRALIMSFGTSIPKSHLETLPPAKEKGQSQLPRTAVLIRTWFDFRYTEEDIMYLRALISELSLMSGGEYTVHFLIHVKDDNLQIWSDDETYERVLRDSLPEEFRGMGTLWSERQMNLIYGGLQESFERGLPVHGVYRSTFMPVQYFSYLHPEYDYVWNWEMDVRNTGHWYHFFDKSTSWAKKQPRKGLWERNSRYYVPSVHGPWEDFMHTVRVQTELGTNNPNNMWNAMKDEEEKSDPNHKDHGRHGDNFIWGPERPHESDILELDEDVIPPTTIEKDKYEWGVGEEADLIVLNPLYDPEGTTWLLRNDVTGYNRDEGMPPRRAAIITASRLSRKLLMTMHRETSMKRHTMFSEMWPATTALHHGFKAVSVPHSIYIDRKWPTRYVEAVFNGGRNGATGGARTSIFGDREHNFRGTTWFYSAGFSPNLWRRWLGYKVDNDGGEEEELSGEGRICLPPMLLHPVKEVQLVIDDGGVPEIAEDSPP